MSKNKTLIFLTTIIIVLFLAFPTFSNAKILEDKVNISPYIAVQDSDKNEIVVNKEINSDAFLIGTNVTINKQVNGNVFIISDRAKINEKVNGSVYVVALSGIEIKAPISQSLAFVSKNVYISAVGEIENDVYGIVKNLILEGRVGNNLNLSFSPNANIRISGKIMGNFYYADTRPNITDSAHIDGKSIETNFWNQFKVSERELHEYTVLKTFFFILVSIILGMFLIVTQREWIENTTTSMRKNVVKDVLAGFLTTLVLIVIAISLLMMVFPFAYAGVILALVFIATYISPIFISILIGQFIISEKNKNSIIYRLITGTLVLSVILLIPYLNVLVMIIAFTSFAGEITRQYFSSANTKKIVNKQEYTHNVDDKRNSTISTAESVKKNRK